MYGIYIYFRLIDFKVNVGIRTPYMDPESLFTVAFFSTESENSSSQPSIRKG